MRMPMNQLTIDTTIQKQQYKQIHMGFKSIEVFFLALQPNQKPEYSIFPIKIN